MSRSEPRPLRRHTGRYVLNRYGLNYLFILPGVALTLLFAYVPMAGILISFKNYRISTGIFGSPWNGLANFSFLTDEYFWFTVKNTILLTAMRLVVLFPAPIILALMINEVRREKLRRVIQVTTYLPYFVSWVVVSYLFNSMVALDTGIVNNLLTALGLSQVYFMGKPELFRPIIVAVSVWKTVGWSTIIYLAALAAVNPELHEAARIDGAGRLARIWYVNLPGILPTISVLLILTMPSLLSAGYESILPFVNSANLDVSSVLDVYIVRLGLSQAQYGKATAIGLLTSVLSLFIVLASNYGARKMNQTTLL